MKAKWTEKQQQRWNDWLDHARDWLEEVCDVTEPVKVWRVEYAKDFGGTSLVDGKFYVKVARRLEFSDAVWTVVHELAHVASWRLDKSDSGHGPEFGLAEAALIQLYEAWQ